MMYYYLCSSLPSLAFGKSAPLTAAEFDALCAESLAPAEYERLLSCPTLRVPRDPDASLRLPPVYAAYTRFEQYLRTRFVRFLVGQVAVSQHVTRQCFSLVPEQDFSRAWTDRALYEKYGLTHEEIAFVQSLIKPMDGKE